MRCRRMSAQGGDGWFCSVVGEKLDDRGEVPPHCQLRPLGGVQRRCSGAGRLRALIRSLVLRLMCWPASHGLSRRSARGHPFGALRRLQQVDAVRLLVAHGNQDCCSTHHTQRSVQENSLLPQGQYHRVQPNHDPRSPRALSIRHLCQRITSGARAFAPKAFRSSLRAHSLVMP